MRLAKDNCFVHENVHMDIYFVFCVGLTIIKS